ncbi:MAG TPA: carboxypeptidase-like regulatory domain-containing protein [Gemmatimonadaceae bacterium]|jgi:hypothetical protein
MSTINAIRSSAISLALASCIHNSPLPEDRFSSFAGDVTVSGRVTNSEGSPVEGATITIRNSKQKAVSDADGRYTVVDVPAGPAGVVVSREGYATAHTAGKFSTKRSDSDRNRVDVELLTPDQVVLLSTRQARDSAALEKNGFLEREASIRYGYFVTPDDIDQIQPRTISDIFKHVPFSVIETSGPSSGMLESARTCYTTYVNGVMRHVAAPSDLDTYLRASDVMAAEVYPPGQPPRAAFARAASRPGCTTVAVWTRS